MSTEAPTKTVEIPAKLAREIQSILADVRKTNRDGTKWSNNADRIGADLLNAQFDAAERELSRQPITPDAGVVESCANADNMPYALGSAQWSVERACETFASCDAERTRYHLSCALAAVSWQASETKCRESHPAVSA